jgi:hypothetical protein
MFYRAFSPDKITKAINTIAYNPDNSDDVTYAKDGAEIQNTYAPGTLYDDLGYEPLSDSDEVKQYANGGFPWDAAGDFGSNVGGAIVGQDAGSQIGGTDVDDDVIITVTGISHLPSVYEPYTCDIFERQGGTKRLSYYDSSDILTITNINE